MKLNALLELQVSYTLEYQTVDWCSVLSGGGCNVCFPTNLDMFEVQYGCMF